MAFVAELEAPLPASTGWGEDPQPSLHGNEVTDTNFIVPDMTTWSSWPTIAVNEGLNEQSSAVTQLNALSQGISVPDISQQLLLKTQKPIVNSGLTLLQLPQLVRRPRAQTAPTVFRDVTSNIHPFYPPCSPISVPPTPRSLFSSECGSSSSSPFSTSHDLPSHGNHPGSALNPRLRSASVSRGRPLTRQRRMVARVLDPARVRPHLCVPTDCSQSTTSSCMSYAPQHLDVPLFDWQCVGSDASDYIPDGSSTPSNLSRASSTSSVHRRPQSRSRPTTPYPKPSSVTSAGDGIMGNIGSGTGSTEHTKPNKNRKRNRRDEFAGQRLHFDEKFMETALGDNSSLRKLLDNILGSFWRKDHILEPNYGAENDEVSQGLNLPIERGSSVLLAFINKVGDEHICILCKEVISTRVPRQLGHVRGHIDLRPFPCTGCDSCDPK